MKNIYLLLLALVMTTSLSTNVSGQNKNVSIDDLTEVGPYEVATITKDDGIENGFFYRNATVYYPIDAQGELPMIAIVAGFTEGAWAVQEWGPFYASHGIVAVIIDTYTSFEYPSIRASALLEVIETVKKENTKKGSPLNGALDLDKIAVSGHSMGGGGAQLAANMSKEIKAVIALNPWLSTTSSYFNNNSNVLIIAGGWDFIAPSEEHSFVHYYNTSEKMNKALLEFRFGTHWVGNSPKFNGGDVGQAALAWLKVFLQGEDGYCDVLDNDIFKRSFLISSAKTNYDCSSKPKFKTPLVIAPIQAYPNPTNSVTHVKGFKNGGYQLVDRNGNVVKVGTLTEFNNQINVSNLPKGIYILHIDETSTKIIVQ